MKSTSVLYPVTIALLAAWLALTGFVDFIAIPTLFRNLGDFFKAGDMGILLFSRLNLLEVMFGILLLGLVTLKLSHSWKKGFWIFGMAFVLCLISFTYFLYLTPKITTLTEMWKQADAQGLKGLGGVSDLQQEHQFFHRTYIWIDTLKLFILSVLLIRFSYKQEVE